MIAGPVLFVADEWTTDVGMLQRMRKRARRIEVVVAKRSASESQPGELAPRLLGVEVDFLRFHAGLAATKHEVD